MRAWGGWRFCTLVDALSSDGARAQDHQPPRKRGYTKENLCAKAFVSLMVVDGLVPPRPLAAASIPPVAWRLRAFFPATQETYGNRYSDQPRHARHQHCTQGLQELH